MGIPWTKLNASNEELSFIVDLPLMLMDTYIRMLTINDGNISLAGESIYATL
jgi:hypothetical protein